MKQTCVLLYLIIILFFGVSSLNAQIITYPVSAQPIAVAFDSTLLTVNVTGATTSSTITITLPTGVYYVPGSFAFTSGSGTVIESGTTSVPVFNLTGATSSFTFTIKRRADCSARTYALTGGTFKDVIKVNSVTENSPLLNNYDIKYATLTITQPPSLANVSLDSAQVRTFSIQNSGLGCVDTVFLTIDFSTAGQIPNGNITADGVRFSPDLTLSTSTKKIYKIFGTPTMSGGLCSTDPAINISEPILVIGCSQVPTNYTAGWGTNATNICQSATTTANLTVINTVPLLNTVVTVNPPNTPYCAGNPYATFKATITNNGNGPAENLLLYLGNYSGNSLSLNVPYAIDTASVLINGVHPTGISVQTTPTSWQLVKDVFSPACIVGQPGQCMITFPAGYSLPASGTIKVTWNVFTCNGGACGDGFGTSNIGVQLAYDNACVNQHTITTPQVVSYGLVNNLSGQSMELPAQVVGGNCFKLLVDFGSSLSSNGSSYFHRYAQVKLTLPVGMTISNLATDVTEVINNSVPHTGYPKQIGQDVYFRFYPGASNEVKFIICTPVNGPPCGLVNMAVDITQVNDSTCSIGNQFTSRQCLNKTLSVMCAGGACPGGGISPATYSFYRTSYGLPDNNQDGIPDVGGNINLTKIDLDRYRPGDTLHSVFSGSVANQTAPSSITNWNNVIAEWSFGNATWQATSAKVTLKRSGVSYVATGVPITVLTPNTGFRANWSAVSFSPSFPAGGYIQGDSVIVSTDFIYLPTLNNSANIARVSDVGFDVPTTVLLTHTVYATQIVSPVAVVTGSTGFTCFIPAYNANVLGYESFINVASVTAGASCNSASLGFTSFARVLGGYSSKQYFLYEYRPIVKVDSIIINAPQGWEYGGANTTNYYNTVRSGVGSAFNNTLAPVITGSTSTGYTLKYDINAAYKAGSPWELSTEGYNFDESSLFRPTCNTPAVASLVAKEYGHFVNYPNNSNPASYVNVSTINNGITYSGGSKPAITMTNNTGEVVEAATKFNNYWDVQITGTNFNPAKYVWLATEQLAGSGLSVLRVEYPIGTTLAPAGSYGVGKYIYNFLPTATTGLINPNNVVARIYFTKNGCSEDSMSVLSGWDCTAFATNPANSGCAQQMFLYAASPISEIQLIKITEPAPNQSVDICSQINYKIQIVSTQTGDVDSPVVKINVPVGMQVVGNQFTFEYPDSSNPKTITILPTGTAYTINLQNDSLVSAAGLNGLMSAQSDSQRIAYLSFKLQVSNCSFIQGVSPTFQIFASKPCNSPAIGNGLTVSGNPVKPIPQNSVASFTENLSISGINITCSSPVIVKAVITSGDGNTLVGDSAVYKLPQPLKYKAGSFSVTGGNISSVSVSDSLLVVHFPAQISNNVTLQFGVIATDSSGCSNTNYIVIGNLFRSSSFSCPLSFGNCQFADSTDADTVRLQIYKPNLSTSSFSYTTTGAGNNIINYVINIVNNGNLAASKGAYIVKIYCGTSAAGNELYSFANDSIGIGATTTHTGSFMLNSLNCSTGSTLYAQVQDTLSNGTTACLCSAPTGTLSAVLLPLNILDFNALNIGNAVNISWLVALNKNDKTYEVERSIDGISFSTIKTITASDISSYNTTDDSGLNLNTVSLYYRLKVIDITGNVMFSKIVELNIHKGTIMNIFPNPFSNQLNIHIDTKLTQNISIKLTDYLGNMLRILNVQASPGINNFTIEGLDKLSPSVYFLEMYFEKEGIERIKLIKN